MQLNIFKWMNSIGFNIFNWFKCICCTLSTLIISSSPNIFISFFTVNQKSVLDIISEIFVDSLLIPPSTKPGDVFETAVPNLLNTFSPMTLTIVFMSLDNFIWLFLQILDRLVSSDTLIDIFDNDLICAIFYK